MSGEERARLLDGLTGSARLERGALVDELLARGFGVEELLAAHAEDRLLLLPLVRLLREEGTDTLEAIAAREGVDPEGLVATRRALGLSVRRGEPVYGRALGEHAVRLREGQAAGMPLEALVAINQVIGSATASIAAGARDAVRALLADAAPDERDRALRAAEAADALRPILQDVVGYALGEHLRELLLREAGTSLILAGHEADVREIVVGFADLVGFTALGEGLEPARLGALATRLESHARDALQPRCDLVKTLGDGVMLAAAEPGPLVASLDALLRAVTADELLPDLRAGVATGPAVGRAGDWYGGVVNLASRLTAIAPPGTVAAPAAFAAAVGHDGWEALGPREIRGLTRPVDVVVRRPAGAEGP